MGGRGSSSGLQTQAGGGGASAKGAGSGTIMAEDPRIKVAEELIARYEKDIADNKAMSVRENDSFAWKVKELEFYIKQERLKIDTYKAFPGCSDDFVRLNVDMNSVPARDVKELSKPLSTDEIVDKIAGGDLTQGSCASAAWVYIGNKFGLDVFDFRGGDSEKMFSRFSSVKAIGKFKGVNAEIQTYDDRKTFAKKLESLEKGKEYYVGVARHAAIVRNTDSGLEFLELQSSYKNGWKPFKGDSSKTVVQRLAKRFGWDETYKNYHGGSLRSEAVIAEVGSFKGSAEFKHILRYLNTAENEQKKGSNGHER